MKYDERKRGNYVKKEHVNEKRLNLTGAIDYVIPNQERGVIRIPPSFFFFAHYFFFFVLRFKAHLILRSLSDRLKRIYVLYFVWTQRIRLVSGHRRSWRVCTEILYTPFEKSTSLTPISTTTSSAWKNLVPWRHIRARKNLKGFPKKYTKIIGVSSFKVGFCVHCFICLFGNIYLISCTFSFKLYLFYSKMRFRCHIGIKYKRGFALIFQTTVNAYSNNFYDYHQRFS